MFSAIADALAKGETIIVAGFGDFTTKETDRIKVSNFIARAIHSSGYRGTRFDAEAAVTWKLNFRHPPKDRAACVGRNLQTGEAVAIAASRGPAFKAGKALRDAVHG